MVFSFYNSFYFLFRCKSVNFMVLFSFFFFWLCLIAYGLFDKNYSSYQFLYIKHCTLSFNLQYSIGFGLDGIGFIFIFLTTFLFILNRNFFNCCFFCYRFNILFFFIWKCSYSYVSYYWFVRFCESKSLCWFVVFFIYVIRFYCFIIYYFNFILWLWYTKF